MKIRDEEQLCGRMRLTAWRAPTDNDQNMRAYWELVNIWQGENLDRLFSKVYECRLEKGIIRVTGALAGVSRLPLLPVYPVRFGQKGRRCELFSGRPGSGQGGVAAAFGL